MQSRSRIAGRSSRACPQNEQSAKLSNSTSQFQLKDTKENNPNEFGTAMNLSSSCLTARQMLPASPSQANLNASASFVSSRAGHGNLQARGQLASKAEQSQYHKQLSVGASTSRVYSARPGQLSQSNLPGPPSESASRRVKHTYRQT